MINNRHQNYTVSSLVVPKFTSALRRGLNKNMFSIDDTMTFRKIPSLSEAMLYTCPFCMIRWNLKYTHTKTYEVNFNIYLKHTKSDMYFLQMECNTQTTNVSTEASGKPQTRDPIPEKSDCMEKQPSRPKKRANAVLRAVAELKSLQESINTSDTDEDAYDVFGRSVAMQLKKLSEEVALLAQCRIQTILTEMGIEDFRRRNHCTSTSHSNPASVASPSSGNESPMTRSNMSSGSTNFVPYDCSENYLVHTPLFNTFSSTNE